MLVDRRKKKNIFFIVMAVLALFFITQIAEIALMIFAAFVISCTLIPIVNKAEKYMPRALAVTIILTLVISAVMLVFIPLTIFTLKQGYAIFQHLPHYVLKIQTALSFEFLGFSPAKMLSQEAISNYARSISTDVLTFTVELTKTLANSLTAGIVVTIITFYACYDTKHIEKSFLKFFPNKFKDKAEEILHNIMTKIGGFVFGQLLTMAFVGIATAIGLVILKNPAALSLGFITFVLDIVPVIGPVIAIALAIISIFTKGIWVIVLTFCVCLLAQILQNQLVRPYVLGKFMDMHPLIIIISLLIGAKFIGVWGVILAPAIASVTCVLVDELYIKQINAQDEEKEEAAAG